MPLPDSPKLHLNENLSPRLAKALRAYGFDVTSSQETDMLTTSDDEQLEYAASEQRAIMTLNISDFAILHNEYVRMEKEHWGIIFSSREPIGVLFDRLLRLLNSVSSDDLRNQIRWLNEFK